MKQENIETKNLRAKMAIGYILILLLVGGIVHTWIGERHELERLKKENERIDNFRKEVHEVYVRVAELSLMGETILEWDNGDVENYHRKRLEVDSLLQCFKPIYDNRRIDSICHLLADKEEQLHRIMEVLEQQDAINRRIAKRVPVIAQKSTQEEPQKAKRTGFLGIFGKKEKPKPTATTTMLYTLNRDMIAQQQAQSRQLSEYADSLAARNTQLNHQLQKLIQQMDEKVQGDFQLRELEITTMREHSFHVIGGITGFVIILLMLSYIVIHRNTKRIHRYKEETTGLIAQLQKALDENNLLLSARRKAMFTIIHELRTPLTAINGYAELLPQADSDVKRAGYMESIRFSAGRMTGMLNTLLAFFRLDSGKEQANMVAFRLQSVADTLRTEFEPLAEAKELTLRVAECADIILVGDRERLIQIGDNLLGNAVKFTEHGTIDLGLAFADGQLTLTVSDTGTGMSKEQQERIFDAFERLPNAAVQDGFGLGLSIVKNIVAMLEGTIHVESEAGAGSRFTVTLPMKPADNITLSEKQQAELVKRDFTDSYSVLALDNDEMMLAMMREMYNRHDVRCDTCTNVEDLMEAVRAHNYDLLITDLRMPEMNGYDVLKLLRSSSVGNAQTVPVVVTTAAGNCDENSLLAHGFTGCLFKPFSLNDLLEVSERCIERKGAAYIPDFSSLLAYGNKDEMLGTLITATEKDMQGVEQAGKEKDRKALDEWVHHLRSSWAVIRADKPLWKLHGLLHNEDGCTDEEVGNAVSEVLGMGKVIVEQAKKERSIEDESSCD